MGNEAKLPLRYEERIMSTMKDPYDFIEWKPDPNHRLPVALDYGEDKRWRRKRIHWVDEPWIGHIYDLIALFTLSAVVATLLKFLLN